MAWTDEQVDEMIHTLLDAAEGADWDIAVIPPTMDRHKGSLQIDGERPFRPKTEEEVRLVMEAFERMENEFYYVQHRNGVMHRVTPDGRAALGQYRAKQKAASKQWNVIGISYSPDDSKILQDWGNKHNANMMLCTNQPAFRDNVPQMIQQFNEADVDGFVIADVNNFKPKPLSELYTNAKQNNFYLFSATRGDAPLTDEDLPQMEVNLPQQAAPLTINIHGNQNVIATHGGINKQIENHLKIVQESNPDIAIVLNEFAAAVEKSSIHHDQVEQLLSRIDTLAKEISAKPPKSQHWSVVERAKGLVEYAVSIVSINHGVHYLLEHSNKLMPLITAAFGGA